MASLHPDHEHHDSTDSDSHHHHHHHSSSSPSTPQHTRSLSLETDTSFGPSPIRIDHDYDIQHNLSERVVVDDDTPEPTLPDSGVTAGTMLSPTSATFYVGTSPASQWSTWTPTTPQTASTDGGFQTGEPTRGALANPFNFTPQPYVASNRAKLSRSSQENLPGKRKGHKYRHSSIHTAHQIFQPPTQRTPLAVPASLPMPTRREAWFSLSSHQSLRLAWCLTHFVIAGVVQFSASGSLSLTALSRLLLFDAASATVCVAVDVMSNFEVWSRSTLRHPFGLGRADVLAGFAMAIFAAFMGLDVISHGTQHALENLGDHEAHSPHSHARPSGPAVRLVALAAAAATLVSALGLRNHARIGRAMRVRLLDRWGAALGNPSHVLTLSCCALVLPLPLLESRAYKLADPLLSFLVAGFMITLGVRLGRSLGSILLMSYTHPSEKTAVRDLISEIETGGSGTVVQEAKVWQVHYGLGLADLKVKYRGRDGYAEEVAKVRQRITSLIRGRLGGVYGDGKGPRWDVSVQVALERD